MGLIIVTILVIVASAILEEVVARRLTLKVSPHFILRRGPITATIRVPSDPRNTGVMLSWTSDSGTEGSSWRKIDGDDGPSLFVITLPDCPPANYEFVATLMAGDLVRAREVAYVYTADSEGSK